MDGGAGDARVKCNWGSSCGKKKEGRIRTFAGWRGLMRCDDGDGGGKGMVEGIRKGRIADGGLVS